MYTSCFRLYNFKDSVSIAVKAPPYFQYSTFTPLQPKWEMVSRYKQTGDRDEYTEKYYRILEELNPRDVLAKLQGKVLLCWELPGEFCHRKLVANWVEAETGIKVRELSKSMLELL